MPSPSPERWHRINEQLDRLLDLPDSDRDAWISALAESDAPLAGLLAELLAEHRALEGTEFLRHPPQAWSPAEVSAGQTVGAYTLVSPIGAGGMGSVWLAERSDGRFERRAAVKFLNVALVGRGGEERFKREGSILGRLAHPHIAELLDAGVSATGQPYLVLEHVEGSHVDRHCDEHQLTVGDRVRLFLDVLSAVAHAHANLIVHRDIKPSNVLVRNDGHVKLLDFGIAKLLENESAAAGATFLTHEWGGPVTPAYAAPEQLIGAPVTTATDVYSLGVLLYVLLSDQHPAGAGPHSTAEFMRAAIEVDPPPPSRVAEHGRARALRGDLDTIVGQALKKDARERYASVAAFAEDLRRHLDDERIAARPDTFSYRAARLWRRNPAAVVLAGAAMVAVIAGVVATMAEAHRTRAQRDFAFRQVARAEAINDLNSFLLSDAAAGGVPFTVDDLLARAEHLIHRQGEIDDPTRIDLLSTIGLQYMAQDEDGRARPALEEAYRRSRSVADPSTRASAGCALAKVLARTGELDRAESLTEEGLRALPDEPQFTLHRLSCLSSSSDVAREKGQAQRSIDLIGEARRLMEASPFRSEQLELDLSMSLAEAYRSAGRLREASATFEQLVGRFTALGRDDTETAATLLNNWGLTLGQLGHPREGNEVLRRAIAISSTGVGERSVSPMLLLNYGRNLAALYRFPEAIEYGERARSQAAQAGDSVVVNQSLLMLGAAYRDSGDYAHATERLDEVEPRLRQELPPGHVAFGSLQLERALVALGQRDLQRASTLMAEAFAITEAAIQSEGQGADAMPTLLTYRSQIELALGHTEQAAADAQRSLDLLVASLEPGTLSTFLGHTKRALGDALRAQGKVEPARTAYRAAADDLAVSLGPDHPETQRVRELAQKTT